MNCQRFESMLADALGDELSPDDRSLFDGHLASCDGCHREYDADRQTIDALKKLPGPEAVTMERVGPRVFLSPLSETPRPGFTTTARRSAFRFAAAILISFTTGYALHAGLMMDRAVEDPTPVISAVVASAETHDTDTLASALALVHQRNPARSDLAKCMIAMFDGSKN